MPGTTGDSNGTHHDNYESPMEIIHNRRDGELVEIEEETDPAEKHPQHEPKELDEEEKKEKIEAKYAGRYSQYWPDDKSGDSSED